MNEHQETTELSRAMRAATEDLRPRPGLAEAVVRGARRRRVRRWTVGAAVLAVVVGVGAVVVVTPRPVGEPATAPQQVDAPERDDPSVPWLTRPTKGSLAGDQAYLDRAVAAWRRDLPASPNRERITGLTGEPHVYWAGEVPGAGRVALVAQLQVLPEPAGGGRRWPVVGLLTGEQPAMVQDVPVQLVGEPDRFAFQFGPGDEFVLAPAVDGSSRYMSPGYDEQADGHGARTWWEMQPLDGVAYHSVPDSGAPADTRIGRTASPPVGSELPVLFASDYPAGFHGRDTGAPFPEIPGAGRPGDRIRIGGTEAPSLGGVDDVVALLAEAGYADPYGRSALGAEAIGDLPGGRVVHGFAFVQVARPVRFFAVITAADGRVQWVGCACPVRPENVLVGHVRLPDGLGWLVVRDGAELGYVDESTRAEVDSGTGAAVVPDDTTMFRVAVPGQYPITVVI